MNKTVGSPVLCVARQMAWVLFACDTPKTLELKTCHVCLSSLGMATSSWDPPPLSTQAHMPKTWTIIFTLYTPKVKGLWMMPSAAYVVFLSAAIKAALGFFSFSASCFKAIASSTAISVSVGGGTTIPDLHKVMKGALTKQEKKWYPELYMHAGVQVW